jgi:hypothetical protein
VDFTSGFPHFRTSTQPNHTKIWKHVPVMLIIVSEYFQDLWDFIIISLGRITEGTGFTEGPGEDCKYEQSSWPGLWAWSV